MADSNQTTADTEALEIKKLADGETAEQTNADQADGKTTSGKSANPRAKATKEAQADHTSTDKDKAVENITTHEEAPSILPPVDTDAKRDAGESETDKSEAHKRAQALEEAGKETAPRRSDPRESVYDQAPNRITKTEDDREHDDGVPEHVYNGKQVDYVAEEDTTIPAIADELGFPEWRPLAAANGRGSGRLTVRKGETVKLPHGYVLPKK